MTTDIASIPLVDRRSALSREEFIASYLRKNVPVVVTDAMTSWAAPLSWTFDFFRRKYGELEVPLQGDFFGTPIARMKLGKYLDSFDEYESSVASDGAVPQAMPYLRYDDGLSTFVKKTERELVGDWDRPYFLPSRYYVRPFMRFGSRHATSRYPDFGIYISPRGALTRLHVDGDRGNAILCQVRGVKRAFLYNPLLEPALPRTWRTKAREGLNLNEAPQDYGVEPSYEALLGPGEILFIPRSWFHEVYTLERSVSIAFNFVHASDSLQKVGYVDSWFRHAIPLLLARVSRSRRLGRKLFSMLNPHHIDAIPAKRAPEK